uniref:Uncharacterized protein n=1 Tax=Cucumis melo TaxID=3656 RepID=A0A9I9D1D2_CUCME
MKVRHKKWLFDLSNWIYTGFWTEEKMYGSVKGMAEAPLHFSTL